MGEGGKWGLRCIIYSGRVMRLTLKTWRTEKSWKDRWCAAQTVKSTGSRLWRANLSLNEKEWPRRALHEDQALWGQVTAGPFMKMLKSQQQAWRRQEWKFSVEENDREIGSWWSAAGNLSGFMVCIYAFVRKPGKKGLETAFRSRKAPRPSLSSAVCRKRIQQRVYGEGCKDCKAPELL